MISGSTVTYGSKMDASEGPGGQCRLFFWIECFFFKDGIFHRHLENVLRAKRTFIHPQSFGGCERMIKQTICGQPHLTPQSPLLK